MKIRLKGNSLRLRLLRGEVAQFAATGQVIETIRFGATSAEQLTYALTIAADAQDIAARFDGQAITVNVPAQAAQEWAASNTVGLYAKQPLDATQTLQILIEKDFVCLDRPTDEDNKDAYPHPTQQC